MKIEELENKIFNADSYEMIKEIPDKSIDLIVTDPPYEIKNLHGSGIMKDRAGSFSQQIQENNLDVGIKNEILEDFVRVMKKINIYLFCNKEQIIQYLDFFVKERKCNWEMIIIAKTDAIPFCGTHYLVDKEYCLYFWETGVDINIPYERAKTVYVGTANKEDKKKYKHPTIKSLELVKNLILNSSRGGGNSFR